MSKDFSRRAMMAIGGAGAALCAAPTAAAAPTSAKAATPKARARPMEDHFADSDGVKIHYVARGAGPLVVMLHGFPDFSYTWRALMGQLDGRYRCAALDLRGYNLSDKPQGEDKYAFRYLIGDVAAVIKAEGRSSAIVVGHDWGAAIAWQVAINRPDLVDRLVILSVPHPVGLARELATNKDQQANSQYARDFQKPGAEKSLTAEGLAGFVADEQSRSVYVEAFKRSDFTAMLNYYRANYPKDVGAGVDASATASLPKIKAPVLVIHGVKDTALNAKGHNSTWEQVEQDTTILMIPSAGHWVQHDAPALVNGTIYDWLNRRSLKA